MFSILLIRSTKYEIIINRSQLYNYEFFVNFQIIVALSQLKERANLWISVQISSDTNTFDLFHDPSYVIQGGW